jgi:hypothetical protein
MDAASPLATARLLAPVRTLYEKYSLHCASSPPRRSLAPCIRAPRPPRPRCPLTAAASTEPGSLYDECSSKWSRGGASCDTAPPASCPRRCHISELHALPPTSATTSLHSFEQYGDIALKVHVSSVSAVLEVCCK